MYDIHDVICKLAFVCETLMCFGDALATDIDSFGAGALYILHDYVLDLTDDLEALA